MTDVFISYASDDAPTMRGLRQALERLYLRVWTYEEHSVAGSKFAESYDEQIGAARAVVALISEHYFVYPDGSRRAQTLRELSIAQALEANKRTLLIPVLLRMSLDQVPRTHDAPLLPIANLRLDSPADVSSVAKEIARSLLKAGGSRQQRAGADIRAGVMLDGPRQRGFNLLARWGFDRRGFIAITNATEQPLIDGLRFAEAQLNAACSDARAPQLASRHWLERDHGELMAFAASLEQPAPDAPLLGVVAKLDTCAAKETTPSDVREACLALQRGAPNTAICLELSGPRLRSETLAHRLLLELGDRFQWVDAMWSVPTLAHPTLARPNLRLGDHTLCELLAYATRDAPRAVWSREMKERFDAVREWLDRPLADELAPDWPAILVQLEAAGEDLPRILELIAWGDHQLAALVVQKLAESGRSSLMRAALAGLALLPEREELASLWLKSIDRDDVEQLVPKFERTPRMLILAATARALLADPDDQRAQRLLSLLATRVTGAWATGAELVLRVAGELRARRAARARRPVSPLGKGAPGPTSTVAERDPRSTAADELLARSDDESDIVWTRFFRDAGIGLEALPRNRRHALRLLRSLPLTPRHVAHWVALFLKERAAFGMCTSAELETLDAAGPHLAEEIEAHRNL